MPATVTYTHVGGNPNVAYVHRSARLFGHTDLRPGKSHALTADGRVYRAACGEFVCREYENPVTGWEVRDHVRVAPDAAGTGVTCARCRKLLGVQRYAVQYRNHGRWFTVKGGGAFDAKADAAAFLAETAKQYPAVQFRVRLV